MKTITPDNYVVRPFVTHKTQEYDYTFIGGSNPTQVSVDVAIAPPTDTRAWWSGSSEASNPSGIYKRALYTSVQNLLTISGSNSALTGSTLYVVSVSQLAFGEGIHPGTFQLSAASTTGSLQDDGRGRIVSVQNTGSVVGQIFYGLGVAVIAHRSGSTISTQGMYLTTGSVLDITFDATHTIYEHQVICTMDEGEFNFSTNPSMRNETPPRRIDLHASGTLNPYMTTVGLYNDAQELLAVAKFPRAIKRVPESQQSVIVRFDV